MFTHPFIPFSRADIGPEEVAAVAEVLTSGWTTSGPKTAEFESRFRTFTAAPHALAVNSCTAGLHLALAALGIGEGDEVITTPLTFCATINTILEVGATPVLADVGDDLNISVEKISAAITPRTRAVLPVHLGGLPCDMQSIWRLASRHGLKVIEDAAHAVGAACCGAPIGGGMSDAVAFSFYATKNLSTGEGGMITTASREVYERMRLLCLHGISRDAWNRYAENGSWYYEVVDRGFKYNMSDIMAALGCVQLQKLPRMNRRRSEIAACYNDAFSDMPELELPPDRPDVEHAWHLYVLRLNLDRLDINRDEFIREMKDRGIGCSVHFIPIPMHPYYRETLEQRDPCRNALRTYPRLVSLPLYSSMNDEQVECVIEAVREIVACCRSSRSSGVLEAV